MRQIKLVGRELAVVRAIDSTGSLGEHLRDRTAMSESDLLDTLNALFETGYVEAYLKDGQVPSLEPVQLGDLLETRFEINPAYYLEIKKVAQHR